MQLFQMDSFQADVAEVKCLHLMPVKCEMITPSVSNVGPVVKSIVSLMKPLVSDLLSHLVPINQKGSYFLLKKCDATFASQKFLTFSQQKIIPFLGIIYSKF